MSIKAQPHHKTILFYYPINPYLRVNNKGSTLNATINTHGES